MVQQEDLIASLYERCHQVFEYHQGRLYWTLDGSRAGGVGQDGYLRVRLDGKAYLSHRIIFLMRHGYLPNLVDHIDRNIHNNSLENLREADKRINAINSGLATNNTSGVKGISWHKAGQKWTAQIKDHGRKIHLGSYINLEDAIEARQQAEKELWHDIG